MMHLRPAATRRAPFAALAALLLLATGCDTNDGDGFDVNAYLGTYTGLATATVNPGSGAQSVSKPATATFTKTSDGNVTLLFVSTDPEDSEGEQRYTGTYDSEGMHFSLEGIPAFSVSSNGTISGTASQSSEDLSTTIVFSGSLTGSRLRMNQDIAFSSPIVSFTGTVKFTGTK